ncbi:PREDICTED: spermine oxidase-like [Dufourea novaeangliae]|uniref:spermine oxidase-like n=1 Tax=Dufourea novaeangliae TaxID=178035 RepID=UPI000767A4C2|nr:PREDICTED: spermine oxidase-like [Dufourea novaeangliae]
MINGPKIIIVGAGASGIAAAARLLERGIKNVTILEGKDRIGGRIHTVEFSDNVIELGAQWVHGEKGNIVSDIASPHKLLDSTKCFSDFSAHIFVNAKGEILPQTETTETLKIYYDISEHLEDDLNNAGSYGEYFIKQFYKIFEKNPFTTRDRAEQLLDWMHKFDNSIQCSDSWFDVSAKGITQYWTCEGEYLLNWKYHGYKTLFDLLSKLSSTKDVLPIMEKIEFNKDVSNIDYTSKNNVTIKTKDGSKYTASHVIFTPSLGVLKEKHETMFTPILPGRKQHAIKGLNIGTVNKIFLEFPHRWWQEDCTAFSLIWSKEDKKKFLESHGQEREWLCDVFAFIPVDYQPRVLCAWISGKYAKHIELLSDSNVSDGLHLLLETFLNKSYNIPRFDRMLRSSWYMDEHFRGSYSYRSTTTEKLDVWAKDLADPILTTDGKPIILFAGEATHDHYYSTVHGAVETGFREADRIIDFHRTCGWLKQVINNFDKMGRILRTGNQTPEKTKIVIVGAGIAGLAAAKTLEEANFKDYLLLEAQSEIGGRIRTIPWNKTRIECGAQFLHGDQSQLGELCYQNGLISDIDFRDGQGSFIRNNGAKVDEALVEEIDDLVRTTLEDCENEKKYLEKGFENLGNILKNALNIHLRERDDCSTIANIKKELMDWNVRFIVIDNSCLTLEDMSTKYWCKFKFVGGSENLLFKLGYDSLTKLIADGLNAKNLRLNTTVDCIEWRRVVDKHVVAPVVLNLSDNTRILSDCVIITSSLGYLKDNYKTMFVPPLPQFVGQAIENLGFGLINKIFLDFGKAWWKRDTKGFQFLWPENTSGTSSNGKAQTSWTRDLTGFDVLPDSDGVLLGWVGGCGAYIVETLSEQQIAADCERLLKQYLKIDAIPPVIKCLRTKWYSNPYIRGSYSHIPTRCDDKGITPATLAEPICSKVIGNHSSQDMPTIMFAGEATSETHFSTTHGAYDTGVQQARVFLRYHAYRAVDF